MLQLRRATRVLADRGPGRGVIAAEGPSAVNAEA
jgi:hypothetical protein